MDYSKFTASSRNAVVNASDAARVLGHMEIGAGHLLLGLLATPQSHIAEILGESGIGVQSVREALRDLIPRTSEPISSLRLAPELLLVLEAAATEHDEVAATVLCHRLLSDSNTATDVMEAVGVERTAVLARLYEGAEVRARTRRHDGTLEDRVQRAVERAELLAMRVGRAADEGDVAVTLLDDPDSSLTRALAHLDVYREGLEEALADTRSA